MSGVYERAKATAKRLIQRYGGACEWHSAPAPAQGSQTPWKPGAQADIVHPGVMVAFVPMNERQYRKAQWMTKTDTPTGFEMAYMSSQSFVPTIYDTVIRSNGVVYRIKAIDSVDPDASGEIVYEILVQR